jgi:cell division initiation protein
VKITPLDVRRKEFKRSVRGYLDEEVDLFLDGVADELERLAKENGWLQDRVQALEEQAAGHTHIREALEKTLVAAQLQSEEIRSNAEKEGESILRQAEAKAKAMVADLYAQTQRVQQTLIQLKLLEEDFRFKFRALLEGYVKLLEESPILLADMRADSAVEGSAAQSSAEGEAVAEEAEPQDGPTLDTEESSTFVGAAAKANAAGEVEALAVSAENAAQGGSPPTEDVTQVIDGPTEEFTVETAPPASDETPARGNKSGKTKKSAAEKGVFFGRLEDDPDDPFPGSDVKPTKARDFEW